ncbi:short chain dehydrogenase [Mytilinidion resinicola]|uniref:Short chain dehydrogenase n=1 Tax=Mytilinidion resinicola TaxID=574789 RepID=A0A6A6YDL1_9PEZI|nr:short chain dehydrogenase [Mytilinidion resinicola]KAF2805937.1 short chain dehydrogenase [Mytilinidion resinicola]
MASLTGFLRSQLLVRLPLPTASYAGKTVIVTGSNVGLGKEAARHFAALGASTLVLAVRSLAKGEAAKKDILATTKRPADTIQVWQLDMGSYASVQAFAARAAKELERIDVLLENAGIATNGYVQAEDNESTITINVVSTFLLALLMLPKLRESARKFGTRPTLSITASEVHHWTKFAERKAPEGMIFETLNAKETANMAERYMTSKLLEVFAVRELAEKSEGPVTVNCLNPGLCHSALTRDKGPAAWVLAVMKALIARSTEVGSRTLLNAAGYGPESHGKYISDCKIEEPSAFVRSAEGKKTQARVWDELMKKLEAISPGVTKNL